KTPRSAPELPGPILCTLVIIFKISKGLPGTDSRTNPCQEEGNDGIRATRPDPTDADPAPTLIPGRDYTRPRPTPAPPPEPWRDKAPDPDPEPSLGPRPALSRGPPLGPTLITTSPGVEEEHW
ncbi:hypothetical protein LINPERPRIM_LOCUS32495, partial [Linum perenne]